MAAREGQQAEPGYGVLGLDGQSGEETQFGGSVLLGAEQWPGAVGLSPKPKHKLTADNGTSVLVTLPRPGCSRQQDGVTHGSVVGPA